MISGTQINQIFLIETSVSPRVVECLGPNWPEQHRAQDLSLTFSNVSR